MRGGGGERQLSEDRTGYVTSSSTGSSIRGGAFQKWKPSHDFDKGTAKSRVGIFRSCIYVDNVLFLCGLDWVFGR